MNTDQNLGATPAEVEALVSGFFEQMEPKVKKGRAWTFHRLNAACDTPDGEQIDRFLQSKLHGRSPEDKEKKRLTDALLRRGFSWGEVRSAWGRYGSEIWEE